MSDANRSDHKPPGTDVLIEDMFGLSLRGFRTIALMFLRPREVYEAARTPDWGGSFTPSIRLVFSLLALMAFMQFIWFGDNSAPVLTIEAQLSETGRYTTAQQEDFIERFSDLYAGVFPLAFLIAHLLGALVMRVWGEGASLALRIRSYFLTITPSMVATVFFLLLYPLATGSAYIVIALLSVAFTMLLDFVTAMRGGVVAGGPVRRVAKAALFALVSVSISAIASTVSSIGASFFVSQQVLASG